VIQTTSSLCGMPPSPGRRLYKGSTEQQKELTAVAFVGVATWFRNGTATYPLAARAISSQTPTWWTTNGVY